MRILRKYILIESVVPFIISLFILTCIFLLGNLMQLTNMVINKGVQLSLIGKVFFLYVPVLLGYTLPIACLVSIIVTFSRFSADNEILAMRACGVHLVHLLIPLVFVGFIITLFSFLLNDRLIPYAHFKQHKMLKSLGASNPTALLEAGVFIDAFEDQILFIHKIEGNKLHNITIYQPKPDGPTRTIIAREGEFTPIPGEYKILMKLIDGTSDEPNLENPNNFYKLNFDTFFMEMDVIQKRKVTSKKPRHMTLKELEREIQHLQRLFVNTAKLETEYFRKITWSFSSFAFILLGFPIAVITHRREKSANIVLAILCAAFYYLISLGCEALSIKSIVPASIIMWGPNFVTFCAAAYLNFKCVS